MRARLCSPAARAATSNWMAPRTRHRRLRLGFAVCPLPHRRRLSPVVDCLLSACNSHATAMLSSARLPCFTGVAPAASLARLWAPTSWLAARLAAWPAHLRVYGRPRGHFSGMPATSTRCGRPHGHYATSRAPAWVPQPSYMHLFTFSLSTIASGDALRCEHADLSELAQLHCS